MTVMNGSRHDAFDLPRQRLDLDSHLMRTLVVGAGEAGRALADLAELVEDVRLRLGRDTDTRVDDRHDDV